MAVVRATNKLYVLAGNYREFEMFCHEAMVSKNDAVYLHEPDQIRGMNLHPFQVIHYGSWHTISRIEDISAYLRMSFDMAEYERKKNEGRPLPAGTGTPARSHHRSKAEPGKS